MEMTKVFCWGASHFTHHRLFPQNFENLLHDSNIHPIIFAKGGALLNRTIVDEIKQELKQTEGRRQIHIICLGGNNIRRNTDVWSVEGLASFFEELTIFASDVRGATLILVGMIPSPAFDHISRETFQAMNLKLKKICAQSNDVATYFSAAKLFSPDGRIRQHLYQADGIHLTEMGTRILANGLKERLLDLN